jgi:hypothetical protein
MPVDHRNQYAPNWHPHDINPPRRSDPGTHAAAYWRGARDEAATRQDHTPAGNAVISMVDAMTSTWPTPPDGPMSRADEATIALRVLTIHTNTRRQALRAAWQLIRAVFTR